MSCTNEHILLITDAFFPAIGGAETLFLQMALDWVALGKKVTVLTSHHHGTKDDEYYKGIHIIRVGYTRRSFARQSSIKWYQLITSHLSDFPISQIHTASNTAIIGAYLLSKIFRIQRTITIHEIYGMLWIKLWGRRGITKYLIERCGLWCLRFHEYHCVSRYTRNSLRLSTMLPDRLLHYTPNTLDTAYRSVKTLDNVILQTLRERNNLTNHTIGLFFGSLGYIKWLVVLLDHRDEIRESLPDFRLVIISPDTQVLYHKGKRYTSITSLVEALWIYKDQLTLLEQVPNDILKHWIGLSDVVLLPSLAEWFGYAIAESLAMQKKLLTTGVGGIMERMHHNDDVVIVNPRDHRWKALQQLLMTPVR